MTKTTLFLIALISTFMFNEPESPSITIQKNNIMSKSLTPKGIALVWPEELPKASDGSYRNILKDFYLQLLDKIPSEIEVTVIVKYENLKTKINRELQDIYPDRNFKFIVISSIRDIWIRDWAPIMIMNNSKKYAIKANYEPYYLTKREAEPDNKAGLHLATEYNVNPIDIIWDGGNFTHNGAGIGIITNRIVGDNEHYSLEEISKVIKKSLGLNELILVPVEPGDETGHVDGMVRFINERTVVVAKYPDEYKNEPNNISEEDYLIGKQFLNQLADTLKQKFKVLRIENSIPKDNGEKEFPSAFGNYINYLKIGNTIFLPQYGIDTDTAARQVYEKYFGVIPITIDIDKLANLGGVLNCITWTYY